MKFPNKLFKYILLPFLVLSLSNCNSNSSNNNNNNTNNNNEGTIPQNPNNGENKDVPTGNKVSSALSNFDALPDNLNKTLLSNDEIKNIKNLEDAKSKISTLKDCLRYFSTLTYKNFSYWGFKTSTITDNLVLNTEYRISFNEMNKGVSYNQEFSFNVAQVFTAYILSNDFDEVGTIYAFEDLGNINAEYTPTFGTYYKINNKYHVFMNEDNKCYGAPYQDYANCTYEYFVVNNLETIANGYNGQQNRGIYGLVKDSYKPETTVFVAKNKFILNGTGTVLYTDPNYLASFIEGDIQNDISITDYFLDPELGELNINKIRAQELLYLDHDTLRKEIKTLPDLIYFLYYNHFTSMNGDIALYDNSDTYWNYNRDPYKILKDLNGNCGGYANLTKYLLGDDYEIGNLQMTFDDSNAGGHVINYIKVNNNYYVLDISNLVSNNYKPKGLNLYKTADLQDFASFILTRNSSINLIYEGTYLDGYDFPINWESTCKTTYLPLGSKYTILFSQKDYSIALKKMDMTLNRYGAPVRAYSISNINLNENPLINELGNPKLSQNQLEELSTRTIEEVAAKITTLADLLNLMYLRGMINYENDLKYYISESNVWQFNRNAKTVYQSNFGDCGGLANLANYVLKGDYQSNGFVNYTFEIGKGGGHVTNYIKYNDKYYFFDMTSWFGRGYAPASFEIYKYDQISDYATKASYFFANITMNMCTYEAENDMPVNWKDLSNGVTAYESGYTINEILSKSNYKFSPITLGPNDLYKINYRR